MSTCTWWVPQQAALLLSGTTARLRSKQQLLQTLVERVRDQNAYTRARVLQTWALLAEKMAVPLGHWVCVTEIAVGTAFPSGRGSFHSGFAMETVAHETGVVLHKICNGQWCCVA